MDRYNFKIHKTIIDLETIDHLNVYYSHCHYDSSVVDSIMEPIELYKEYYME